MKIPYVIDNNAHRLADVLNDILRDQHGPCLDVATAYFSISGYRLIQEELDKGRTPFVSCNMERCYSDVVFRVNVRALFQKQHGDLAGASANGKMQSGVSAVTSGVDMSAIGEIVPNLV